MRSYLWYWVVLLGAGLVIAWTTGASLRTGVYITFGLIAALSVGALLYDGSVDWRAGRSFRADHGRVHVGERVAGEGDPILFAAHPAPGTWVFAASEEDARAEKTRQLHIQQVLELDSTVRNLAGLRVGGTARRESAGSRWHDSVESEPVG